MDLRTVLVGLLVGLSTFATVAQAQNGNGGTGASKACGDGVDNDQDGHIDYPNDPGCSSKRDDDEYNAPPPAACQDGLDNDGDGRTDFGWDPGCASSSDNDETNPSAPACSDGVDNDQDGKTDYMADKECSSPEDDNESAQDQGEEPCLDPSLGGPLRCLPSAGPVLVRGYLEFRQCWTSQELVGWVEAWIDINLNGRIDSGDHMLWSQEFEC